MRTITSAELKKGMVLILEGAPQVLEELHTSGGAKTKHKLHGRLRNLQTGRLGERVFGDNERLEVAELEHRRVTFSYAQGDQIVFLDAQTYEALSLHRDQLGKREAFLKADAEYKAVFLEGTLVDIALPAQVPLQVVETAPAIKGGSDSTWKEAKLETGLQIMLPLFIETGEVVRVDTTTGKYVGKEASEK